MKKHSIITFLSLLVCFSVKAQEYLVPLGSNPQLFKENMTLKVMPNSFDSTFIYSSDTLQLPFFDEFSKNKFQQYNAQATDPGVTQEQYFVLTDLSSTPLAANAFYSTQATYRRNVNVAAGTVEDVALESITIRIGDLSNYPPVYESATVYPPYVIIDTLDFPNPLDTLWLTENVVKQDSAIQFFVQINNKNALWLDSKAYWNNHFARLPWSVGVATFDGLNENGFPYAFGTSQVGYADVLTSKPINLSSFSAQDSVYFSFLYQTEGFGDRPEQNDSLIVEFYAANVQQWFRVWSAQGAPVSDFNVVHFPLLDAKWFQPNFQLRFRNYGGLSGSLDHFHIDYVHLRALSGYQDTLFKDFAMVYPVQSLLKEYTSVPWDHYKNNPLDKMTNQGRIVVRNGSNIQENSQNGTLTVSYSGSTEGSFTLSNFILTNADPSQNYAPRTFYESFHDFSTGYRFDENKAGDAQYFDYVATASAQFPNLPLNDSVRGTQVFENYYAYDDGSAEQAYGIIGQQARLAYQFTPYETDSLIGVQMHFVPTVNDVSNKLFLITVWNDNNGKPGNVLYQDEFFFAREPEYATARDRFVTYFLKDTMKLHIDGTFYIGWRQIDEERLNIGFDRNNVNNDKIFYTLDNGLNWINSSFEGSLMMRPLFSTALDATLSIPVTAQMENTYPNLSIYPNPASNTLNISMSDERFSGVCIIDLNGQVLQTTTADERQLDISGLSNGVYFIRDLYSGQTQKLVKQ